MTRWNDFRARVTETKVDGTRGLTVDFRGDEFQWEEGIYVVDVDGLSSGGAVTYNRATRGFGPGVHDVDNRREDPRIIAITGFAYARSPFMLGQYLGQLEGLLAEDDAIATFEWTEYDRDWRRTEVRRFGANDVNRLGSTGRAEFRISLKAADQRVYGENVDTGWGAIVAGQNVGSYPAPLVIEVRGDSPGGWTVAGPRGRAVVVSAAIVPGSTHRYHGDTGLLEIDGVPQVTGVVRSDPIEAPPGAFTLATNNGCQLRGLYASTWTP